MTGIRVALAVVSIAASVSAAPGPEGPLRRVHLVAADAGAAPVQSMKALWKDRVAVCAPAALPAPPADASDVLVVALDGDPAPLRAWAGAGADVVLDLPLFAVLAGAKTAEVVLDNPNRLPFDPYDIEAIEAVGKGYGEVLQGKAKPDGRALAVRDGLRAEIGEPIPALRVEADDPMLRGFAVGDVLPWCGHRKVEGPGRWGEYRQRTVALPAGGKAARALAVSTVDGGAVAARLPAGRGAVYGLDLGSLVEPSARWDDRGSFYKYVPLANLAGPGVRVARYWGKKPTYAEYLREVRRFAEARPEWALDVVGRRGGDEIVSLTLGDPAKPLYVYIGMSHAEDEWAPSLGALAFAELLSRERGRPDVKDRLDRYAVKIYPLLHPAVYESPRSEPGRPTEPDRIDIDRTKGDRPYAIVQLHQGGDVLVPSCGTPVELGRKVAARARDDFDGRYVWWHYYDGARKYGPQVWESAAPVAPMPPLWSPYWWQDGKTSCFHLYPHETVFSAPVMFILEQDFLLLMPERFTQANHHHFLHRMLFEHGAGGSLVLADQTANWCLAILVTDAAGLERDAGWRPEGK
jgi:hypothetical protein